MTSSLDSAAIPHARIQVKNGYTLSELRECIETKLIPLRRRQGKLPYSEIDDQIKKAAAKKRPTRPLSPSRNTIAA